MVECPECGKDFTRRYNMERHRAVAHPCADSEEDSSVTEDPIEDIDPGIDVSDSQRSTHDNSSSDDQSSTDDEEEDDSVWTSIRELSWTPEIDDTFDNKKAELVERGMSTGDAHQIAYKRVLPNLRRNIAMNYMKKILEHTKLRQDPIHQQNLKTKRKLQEEDDYESEEAMRYAVKKRKYLILKATGTLSGDELEDEDENVKLHHTNVLGMVVKHTCLTSVTPFRWWCNKIRNHFLKTHATPQMEWTHLELYVRLLEKATSFYKGKRHSKHLWSLQPRWTIVRYATSHLRGKTTYLNIFLSMQKKNCMQPVL